MYYYSLSNAYLKNTFPFPCIDQIVDATTGHDILSFRDAYLLDQKDMYKFMTLLPKDYCLIPGNGVIKLVDRI